MALTWSGFLFVNRELLRTAGALGKLYHQLPSRLLRLSSEEWAINVAASEAESGH
jgi:hypothetical protein